MSTSGGSGKAGGLNTCSAIIVALVGIVGVLGAAIISNPDSLCNLLPQAGTCKSSTSTSVVSSLSAPLRIQAESHDSQSKQFSNEPSNDPGGGGSCLGYINNGSWAGYKGVDFGSGKWDTFRARVASDSAGGRISVRLGGQSGRTVSTCDISYTGGWSQWRTVDCSLERGIQGLDDVYLVFSGSSDWLINVNWFEFRDE